MTVAMDDRVDGYHENDVNDVDEHDDGNVCDAEDGDGGDHIGDNMW